MLPSNILILLISNFEASSLLPFGAWALLNQTLKNLGFIRSALSFVDGSEGYNF